MKLHYSPKNNPRVIVIQKIYSKTFNKEEKITFEKHRFKKFIKFVVNGTIKIIIKEYLNASNFFIDNSKTKYLNALLDKISKEVRKTNE